jgi:SAM-dependent methyltransferase
MRYAFSGEGPGTQTPDGCSVSLYRALPYLGELEEVIDQFEPGMSVLELGCGTGRLCARVMEVACDVTGVDESPAMLACLPKHVRGVQANVEDLDLGRTFDAVLLASHLINHPDTRIREAFVRTAHRHLGDAGRFLVKRHDVNWLESVEVGRVTEAGGCSVFVEAVARGAGVVHMTLRYELDGQTWRQSFATTPLGQSEIEGLLVRFGFGGFQWRGGQREWVVATARGA